MAQQYRVTLPVLAEQPDPAKVKDVVGGKFWLTRNGVPDAKSDTAKDQLTVEPVEVADGVAFIPHFAWVDDAGLEGEPFTGAEIVAADTEAPPAPVGGLAVDHIGET